MRTKVQETNKIILSVNDKPDMSSDVKEWLDARGFAIVRARSTIRALELINKARYDVVITNLRRTENGSKNDEAGTQLASSIRNMGLKVPIVMYTDNVNNGVRRKAVGAGVNAVCTLPDELFRWLGKIASS